MTFNAIALGSAGCGDRQEFLSSMALLQCAVKDDDRWDTAGTIPNGGASL